MTKAEVDSSSASDLVLSLLGLSCCVRKRGVSSHNLLMPPMPKISRDRYYSIRSLHDALRGEDTILIKGSWLHRQWQRCQPLVRRQELPAEAIWSVDELVDRADRGDVIYVSVSYCWLTRDHPDPCGKQLGLLGRVVAQFLEHHPLGDLAIFLDWCSLYQHPRTPAEETSFNRALSNAQLWYVHQVTHVWLLTSLLPGTEMNNNSNLKGSIGDAACIIDDKPLVAAPVRPFSSRGWTFFEQALSRMITPGTRVLDLGKFDDSCTSWTHTNEVCQAKRKPPVIPEVFITKLRKKRFTENGNRSLVIEKYALTFFEIFGAAEELSFTNLKWTEKDAARLAELLPRCVHLFGLYLQGNKLGDEGAAKLMSVLPFCTSLQELHLDDNGLTSEGIARMTEAWTAAFKDEARLYLES
mmetsp:Transcript_131052/g.238377  ORF Transcript_131052/g.238377 Transcript_131052/m.238377 type:complete len:411 (+) Transcript_131052:91-1323(+)